MSEPKPSKLPKPRTDPTDVAAQVREIADVMSAGMWRPRKSHREFADKWKVALPVVEKRASEASRVVRGAFGDVEELRTAALSFLNEIAHEARQAGDTRGAVSAVKTFADIAGLIVHKVEAKLGGLEKLSDEQLQTDLLEEAMRILVQDPAQAKAFAARLLAPEGE